MRLFPHLVLLLAVATAACRGASDRIVIRLGHIGAAGSPYDLGALKFKELVEARLPGRVDVRVFPSSQLGEDREMLDGLRLGTLEMHVPSSVLHSIEPLLGVFDLPFLIEDRDQFERLLEGPLAARIADSLAARDIVLLGFWENGFRVITNNVRPIVKPDDLRGIKVRTPKDPERIKLFKALGANPTAMGFNELYTALRQGVVEGQENPLSQIVTARLYEVQKFLAVSRHVYSPAYPIMARRFFEGLPDEVRRVLREAAREVGRFHRDLGRAEDEKFLAVCRQHLQVSEIDRAAFEAKTESIYADFAGRFGNDVIDAVRRQRTRQSAARPDTSH